MMESQAIDQLAPALLAAQLAMPAVHKDAVNPHFKNRYASLGAITDAALPVLNANGIVVLQGGGDGGDDDSAVEVVTRLLHTSGQYIESGFRVPMPKSDPQAMGSAITYARRYLLAAMLGIVADDDDDGEAATSHTTAKVDTTAKVYQRPAVAPASPANASKPVKAPSGGLPSSCPVCGSKVWDNREKKASGEFAPKSPDWSCSNKECKTGKFRTGGWLGDKDDSAEKAKPKKGEFDDFPETLAAPLPGEPDWDE